MQKSFTWYVGGQDGMFYLFTLPTGFSFQLIRSICNANLFFERDLTAGDRTGWVEVGKKD